MRKVSVTAIIKGESLYNVTANYHGIYITLLHYELNDRVEPYKYDNFIDMYKTVLNLLKQNGYYCSSFNEFNQTWFDIMWIDLDNPTKISKYGLPL